jgi:hypothetical protein
MKHFKRSSTLSEKYLDKYEAGYAPTYFDAYFYTYIVKKLSCIQNENVSSLNCQKQRILAIRINCQVQSNP